MKINRFSNSDVDYFTELNFDLAEWEKYLTSGMVERSLAEANVYLRNVIEKRFVTEKGPSGPWAKLSPITVALKGGYSGILKKTQKLMKGIRSSLYAMELVITAHGPQVKLLQFGATYATTPKQSYWMWHNLFNKQGHPFRKRTIRVPARPFMGFMKQDINKIRSIISSNAKKSERMGKYPL